MPDVAENGERKKNKAAKWVFGGENWALLPPPPHFSALEHPHLPISKFFFSPLMLSKKKGS